MLARGLQEGEACPVCGSVHHPQPAGVPESVPEKEELEQEKEQYQKATAKAERLSTQAGHLMQRLAEQQQTLLELAETLSAAMQETMTGGSQTKQQDQFEGQAEQQTNFLDDLQKKRLLIQTQLEENEKELQAAVYIAEKKKRRNEELDHLLRDAQAEQKERLVILQQKNQQYAADDGEMQ